MKSLIFVLYLCVAITTVAASWIDDASEKVANLYHIPTADVKACYIETNISFWDGLVGVQILANEDTSDVQKSALKIGCLYTCLFKKKEWVDGTTFNVEKLKNDFHSNPELNEILTTCIDQVKNLINECEVMLNYIKCMVPQLRNSITHSSRKEFNNSGRNSCSLTELYSARYYLVFLISLYNINILRSN